jgi:hypothetical protein
VGKDGWQDAERHLLTLPRPNVLTVWKKRASDDVVGADHLLEALSPELRVTIELFEAGQPAFGSEISPPPIVVARASNKRFACATRSPCAERGVCLTVLESQVALAALCLLRTNSLHLADDAMKGEMGNMKDEMKAEKDTMKGEMKAKKEEMKGKMKARKDAMKAKRNEIEGKMKAHKDAAKGHPAATAPMSATAPTAAP